MERIKNLQRKCKIVKEEFLLFFKGVLGVPGARQLYSIVLTRTLKKLIDNLSENICGLE